MPGFTNPTNYDNSCDNPIYMDPQELRHEKPEPAPRPSLQKKSRQQPENKSDKSADSASSDQQNHGKWKEYSAPASKNGSYDQYIQVTPESGMPIIDAEELASAAKQKTDTEQRKTDDFYQSMASNLNKGHSKQSFGGSKSSTSSSVSSTNSDQSLANIGRPDQKSPQDRAPQPQEQI